MEDQADSFLIESLEQRVMLDGDMPGEEEFQEPEYQAWFMQLPGNVGHAVVDYFDSEMAEGSTDIWRPIAQPASEPEPDPSGNGTVVQRWS